MTLGGGWGVVTADLCAAHGLEVPDLTPDMVSRMDAMLPAYWSRSNPVDIVGERDFSIPLTVLEALLRWDDCDGVINLGILGRRIFVNRMARAIQKADPGFSREFLEEARQALGEFEVHYVREIVRLMKQYGKPVIGVSLLKEPGDQTVYRIDDTDVNGVFFETPERAVKALARMVEYERWLSRATEAPGGPPGPRPAGMEADSR